MPIRQNILRKGKAPKQNLLQFDVLIDVRNDDNQYFNISDFPIMYLRSLSLFQCEILRM